MTRAELADAFNQLAEAAAKLAIELEATEPGSAREPVAASVPTGAPAAGAGVPPASAAAPSGKCPAHNVDFLPSKQEGWQPYCPSKSDDPAWSNRRGYCNISPKSAAQWIKVHTTSAEVPF